MSNREIAQKLNDNAAPGISAIAIEAIRARVNLALRHRATSTSQQFAAVKADHDATRVASGAKDARLMASGTAVAAQKIAQRRALAASSPPASDDGTETCDSDDGKTDVEDLEDAYNSMRIMRFGAEATQAANILVAMSTSGGKSASTASGGQHSQNENDAAGALIMLSDGGYITD
jgi:hypothetical protein